MNQHNSNGAMVERKIRNQSEFVIISSISVYSDFADREEILKRLFNTSSKEMVPGQPKPTAASPHNPPTTAADSQDPPTTAKDTKTTPVIFPGGDSRDEEVEYCFSFLYKSLSQS